MTATEPSLPWMDEVHPELPAAKAKAKKPKPAPVAAAPAPVAEKPSPKKETPMPLPVNTPIPTFKNQLDDAAKIRSDAKKLPKALAEIEKHLVKIAELNTKLAEFKADAVNNKALLKAFKVDAAKALKESIAEAVAKAALKINVVAREQNAYSDGFKEGKASLARAITTTIKGL